MRALNIKPIEVTFGNDDLFAFDSSFGDDLARWVANETLAPEINAAVRLAFVAGAVGYRDVNAISNGVAALNRFPG